MIIASIQDPKIYDADRCADPMYRALLIERLRRMAHNHLWVIDEDAEGSSRIGSQLAKLINSNPLIGPRFNALLDQKRIVRVSLNQDRFEGLQDGLLDHESSVAAMVLSQEFDPDVLLADNDTIDVMNLHQLNTDKAFTLAQYADSRFAEIEDWAMGGVPVGEMSKKDFTSRVLFPLLRHSKQVQVIDKMIARVAINPGKFDVCGRPSANWCFFRETLRSLYEAWDSNPIGGSFEIVTSHLKGIKREGCDLVSNTQAEYIGGLIALPKKNVKIRLKPLESDGKLRELTHDRYIVSNLGFVLGVSRGFDLIGSDDCCKPADIYLRSSRDAANVITKILSSGADQGFYGE